MASEVPDHLRIVRRAQRDLDKVPPKERARLIADLVRIANRTLPGEIKPIPALPGKPLQADAGRFRMLHMWEGQIIWVLRCRQLEQRRQVIERGIEDYYRSRAQKEQEEDRAWARLSSRHAQRLRDA